jgi:alpha-amylase
MRTVSLLKLGLALAVTASIVLSACGGGGGGGGSPPSTRPVLNATYRASGHGAAGDVFVHLFEWPWTAVASECETWLGPKGFKAVQVSPPQEHIAGTQWWTRYQPVSYSIAQSRSGTDLEFAQMVTRCKAVGVGIYVDAVINHMTAGSGTGSNGTVYTKYNYPGLYTQSDFHMPCSINNYQSAANVQDCELVGLADLNTGVDSVQQKTADYLLTLARLGVAGFRIDAAKHMQPVELDAILSKVNLTLAAESRPLPYYFAEVIDYGGEAVKTVDYFGLGYSSGGAADITEFKVRGAGYKFLGNGQYVAQLNPTGTPGNQFSVGAWNIMPADKAVVFLENHDTQRAGGISWRDGATYRLANVWLLAQPYGYPSIMSSFVFDQTTQAGKDAGPPASVPGCASSLESAAAGQWVCEHRDATLASMIAFRRAVAGTAQLNWWDDGTNAIAFSRGDKGFVVINHETTALSRSFVTGLASGKYCDVLGGGANAGACVGQMVTVGTDSKATISLAANTALVLQTGVSIP